MLGLRQRGDTLIEVLFAVTVFSLVVVGSLVIMNQGIAAAERSLEISLVRQQVDAQAETLRFMHDSYVSIYQPNMSEPTIAPAKEWYKMRVDIVATGQTSTSDVLTPAGRCSTTHPSGSFIIDPKNMRYVVGATTFSASDTYAKLNYIGTGSAATVKAEGLWIEPIRSSDGYIDFHIQACWDSVGSDIPMTLATIVRLYEPER